MSAKPRQVARVPRSPAFAARREALALRVALGTTIGDAADELGIARRQAERWLKEPETAALLESFRASTVDNARRQVQAAASVAVACLVKLAHQGDRQAAVELLDRAGVLRLEPDGPPPPPTTAVVVTIGGSREEAKIELRDLTERARAERALQTGAKNDERTDENV